MPDRSTYMRYKSALIQISEECPGVAREIAEHAIKHHARKDALAFEKICPTCGDTFFVFGARENRRKYCSSSCWPQRDNKLDEWQLAGNITDMRRKGLGWKIIAQYLHINTTKCKVLHEANLKKSLGS